MGLPPSTICKPGGEGGLFLPLLPNEVEDLWPVWLRGFLYLVALLYLFCGISVIADVFMEAIDEMTSTEREVTSTDETDEVGQPVRRKVRVWNETVANLTLMALGSSAPEIMLNVVEVVGHNYFAGDLGPSTIVGSAAFNFLIIIAVCIAAVPAPEERRIRSFATFVVTTIWSLFAYFWMYFVLSVWTPDVVTLAEAAITFLCLPALVYMGYHADIGTFGMNGETERMLEEADEEGGAAPAAAEEGGAAEGGLRSRRPSAMSYSVDVQMADVHEMDDALQKQIERVRATHDRRGVMTEQQIVSIAADDLGLTEHKSIATYRLKGSRTRRKRAGEQKLTKRVRKVAAHGVQFLFPVYTYDDASGRPGQVLKHGQRPGESDEDFKIRRREEKELRKERERVLREEYLRAQGIHVKKRKYGPTLRDRLLEKLPNGHKRRAKRLQRERIQRRVEDEERKRLEAVARSMAPRNGATVPKDSLLEPGAQRSDEPEQPPPPPLESSAEPTVTVALDLPPMAHLHLHDEDEPPFDLCAAWREQIVDSVVPHGEEEDEVIEDDEESDDYLFDDDDDDIDAAKGANGAGADKSKEGKEGRESEQQAPGGSSGSGVQRPQLSAYEWAMHLLFVPWKLFYALSTPPAMWRGGLPCFFVALFHIGLLTALVGDVAGILGCVLSIPDPVTAITLVALGTSLPDTFASMIAAKKEPTADASITNVTGSNSVNVFLGLGLPWLFASVYWAFFPSADAKLAWALRYPQVAERYWGADALASSLSSGDFGGLSTHYVVLGGDLGFSVFTFCIVCLIGTAVILARRYFVGGELGGPLVSKYASAAFLVALWVGYIALAIVKFFGFI